jgi:hypothetical protein
MALVSPVEDFLIRSLGPVKSAVARLKYLGEIRRNCVYEHWGMERTYGAERTNAALAEIHSMLWLEVLRTPIKQLKEESEPRADDSVSTFFSPGLVPSDIRGASIRHMRLVARTLSMLAAKDLSKRRAA